MRHHIVEYLSIILYGHLPDRSNKFPHLISGPGKKHAHRNSTLPAINLDNYLTAFLT